MATTAPKISPEVFVKVADVLQLWGAEHPLPDVAVIATSDGSDITPREISRAMTDVIDRAGDSTEIGRPAKTVRMLFSAAAFEAEGVEAQQELVEEILHEFREDLQRWSGSPEPERVR